MASSNSWHRVTVAAASPQWAEAARGEAGARAVPAGRDEVTSGEVRAKRMLDVVLSSVAMAVAMPPMVMAALAIKLDSRGPVLFRSRRVGKNGQIFENLKLRTMEQGTGWARVTRVGGWLRKYSVDELPQLWNVLRGEMSLVGSRPPLVGDAVTTRLGRMHRFESLPGMTGLWLLHGRKQPGFSSYDPPETTYREQWSVWLDLKIIARSIADAVSGTGC